MGGTEKGTGRDRIDRMEEGKIFFGSRQSTYFTYLFRYYLEPTTAGDRHKRVVKVCVVSIFSVSHNQGQALFLLLFHVNLRINTLS